MDLLGRYLWRFACRAGTGVLDLFAVSQLHLRRARVKLISPNFLVLDYDCYFSLPIDCHHDAHFSQSALGVRNE